jgi:hypothetical protein
LFLSAYDGKSETEYSTDCNFTVRGAQTNEAPVKYAMMRLKKTGRSIDRIIALVTPKARESALERFKAEIAKESHPHEINIVAVDIPDDVTIAELLQKTLDSLQPMEQSDSVIVETTGGYRNAVNALTLTARFLRHVGISVEFSIYSDFWQKHVADTKETDEMFELLDAVNVFATSGNPKLLINALRSFKNSHEKTEFVKSIRSFYDMVLCCKISSLDSVIKDLRLGINNMLNAQYDASNPKLLVFRDLVSKIVRSKMGFVFESEYLKPLVRWCCENDYLQQAVFILWENLPSSQKYNRSIKAVDRLHNYRINFAHADGKEISSSADNIRDDVIEMLKTLKIAKGEAH